MRNRKGVGRSDRPHLFITGILSIRRMDGRTESLQDLHLLNERDKISETNQSETYMQENMHKKGESTNGEQDSREKNNYQ